MLICKIFLGKFIRVVTSIITFDCRDNYSDIQQNSTCRAESARKRKMHVELARMHLHYFTNRLLNVSLKRKTFCIIIRRMTTQKGARAVGILHQGAGIRQVSRFSRECLQIPVPCR